MLIYISIQAHYVVWSSSEPPQPLFSATFFSGLTAGPTYQPLVQHSNPDTPLYKILTCIWSSKKPLIRQEISAYQDMSTKYDIIKIIERNV